MILLLFNAGPLDIMWAKLNSGVHVIIECFFPAQATGEALARTFMNEGEAANPAGRLPSTWPTNLQQVRLCNISVYIFSRKIVCVRKVSTHIKILKWITNTMLIVFFS